MLLTYTELKELVDAGHIENVPDENINGGSIDLTLAPGFWVESGDSIRPVDLSQKESPRMIFHDGDKLILTPGEFCLAATEQIFHLPDDIAAHYMLKSSLARAGLGHLFAGYADPTWHGSALTLEFKNELTRHALKLNAGMKCGQIVFFKGTSKVPQERSYAARGQYNLNPKAQPNKGVR